VSPVIVRRRTGRRHANAPHDSETACQCDFQVRRPGRWLGASKGAPSAPHTQRRRRRRTARKSPPARAAAGWCDFSPGGALGPMSLAQGPLRAATAHGGRLMSPEAKFSWLTAAVAVALFGLIVLSLDRITPRDENGAILAIHQRSR
jgi:hypothetical protein